MDDDVDVDGGAPHPDLASLSIQFVGAKGLTYSWKTVPVFARWRNANAEKALFLKDFFGLTCNPKKHPLQGRPFRREWMDAVGRLRTVEGLISECYFSDDGEDCFDIRLEESSVQSLRDGTDPRCLSPFLRRINYRDALGGVMSHLQYYNLTDGNCTLGSGDVHLKWCVPFNVSNITNRHPSRTLFWGGWKLTMHVAPSKIKGANLGCFLSCESASPHTKNHTHMVLPPGVLVDLGIYALPDDYLPHDRFLCKNFVHSHKAQYTFGLPNGDTTGLFDINDHVVNARLNRAARRNVLPFINETDGEELPCVEAVNDPAGLVRLLERFFCFLGCPCTQRILFAGALYAWELLEGSRV